MTDTFYTITALSGYDLSFTIDGDGLSGGDIIRVKSNIDLKAGTSGSYFYLALDTMNHLSCGLGAGDPADNDLIETFPIPDSQSGGAFKYTVVHIVQYHQFLSLSLDRTWIHVFYPTYVYYPTDIPRVWINPTVDLALSNIRLKELSDWRESAYIDLETTPQNGVGSILQQRPVEIYGKWDGSVKFQYFPSNRPEKSINAFVESHTVQEQENTQLSSEAIVYHTNVGISTDHETFRRFGFMTKLIRLPDLDSGAMRAARVTQLRARQTIKQHTINARFDPSLELGDVINDAVELPGTETEVTESAIIEQVTVRLMQGSYSMQVKGRNNE